MTHITLENVNVEFPVYDVRKQLLMRSLIRKYVVGGVLRRDNHDKTPMVTALDGINLELREGDKLAISGNNGAGKTTLLRTILGSYLPTGGRISTQGSIISMLGFNLGFDLEATGYENIFIRGAVMGFSRQQMIQYVDDISEFCELGDYLQLPVRTYSSGMVMRLAFSIATTVPADIVLLDEWLSVGDESFSEKAEARLHDYVSKAKILVLATHNPKLARRVCNRFAKMEAGKLTLES